MRALITALFFIAGVSSALAQRVPCDGCDVSESARNRPVAKQSGGPQSGLMCFYVAMPDPCDALAVEAHTTAGDVTVIEDYGLGAAVNMAQSRPFRIGADGRQIVSCTGREKAMVCVRKSALTPSVSFLRLVPGNKGTCYELRAAELGELRTKGSLPPTRELHIGWDSTRTATAPAGFATLRPR